MNKRRNFIDCETISKC